MVSAMSSRGFQALAFRFSTNFCIIFIVSSSLLQLLITNFVARSILSYVFYIVPSRLKLLHQSHYSGM